MTQEHSTRFPATTGRGGYSYFSGVSPEQSTYRLVHQAIRFEVYIVLFFVNATKPSSVRFALHTKFERDSSNRVVAHSTLPLREKITYRPSSKSIKSFSLVVHPITRTRAYCHSFPGICAIYKTQGSTAPTFFPHESYIRISVVSSTSQFMGRVSSEFHFNAIGPRNITPIAKMSVPLLFEHAAL